jgi:photosystem II stability/assembly factor-like uncharacterized protein
LSVAILLAPIPAAAAQPSLREPTFDSVRFGALTWRSIGPWRGGRAVAVVGVSRQPLVYYAGFAGGGVWKTDDAGINWRNVSDCCFRMGSVGAIAIGETDPSVIYVGMGEHAVRAQSSSFGDGLYKSTDAGRTWRHSGLQTTRQISRIVVHPTNDSVVFVAAQGSRWAPSADRGIYRSLDGGATWQLVLHPSDSAGASELSLDPSNPRVLYAAFWHGQRVPWQVRSGGTTGGIWKTTDGGDTWKKLGGGLPSMMGKVGVSVSPTDSNRVYAIIEAENGGLWRSDDAGATWQLQNTDRRLLGRAWYYMKVAADPKNANVVYVLNFQILKSTDGGRRFAVLEAAHPDNHQLWINRLDNNYIISANDGGASVSINGGRSWSAQDNQPTAQMYYVNVDAQLPYGVYGSQQDQHPIAITNQGSFTAAGGEGAHIAFDPENPRFLYGSGNLATLTELDRQTGTRRDIMPWPAFPLGEPSNEMKYRFNWSPPLATSPHDRRILYYGGNVLLMSADRGDSWRAISPDLTRNDPATQGFGGAPLSSESGGGEVYNTIFSLAESHLDRGTIWVGTDDGLVHLTRDAGRTWANVTPPSLSVGQVNSIDVSRHDRQVAYLTLFRVKWNDNAPYVYRTSDAGRSWTKIVTGLPDTEPVRVVREGGRAGLLFAGTETGVWVSFNAGARWQSIQSNLPPVPVTDLIVERRSGDLVASTEGRGFWILGGTQPLRQGLDTTTATRLFQPPDTLHEHIEDAAISFFLDRLGDSDTIRLEIADRGGRVVRTFGSSIGPNPSDAILPITRIRPRLGLNTVAWDLRTDPLSRIPGPFHFSPTDGYQVPPGDYTVRLVAGGKTHTQRLRLLSDPAAPMPAGALAQQQRMLEHLDERANEIFETVRHLRAVRDQLTRVSQNLPATVQRDTILGLSRRLRARIDSLEPRLIQARSTNNQDVLNYRAGLIDHVLFLRTAIDEANAGPTRAMALRLSELDAVWKALDAQVRATFARDIPALNAFLTDTPVAIPRRPTP